MKMKIKPIVGVGCIYKSRNPKMTVDESNEKLQYISSQ